MGPVSHAGIGDGDIRRQDRRAGQFGVQKLHGRSVQAGLREQLNLHPRLDEIGIGQAIDFGDYVTDPSGLDRLQPGDGALGDDGLR